jgi:hypothetical protein
VQKEVEWNCLFALGQQQTNVCLADHGLSSSQKLRLRELVRYIGLTCQRSAQYRTSATMRGSPYVRTQMGLRCGWHQDHQVRTLAVREESFVRLQRQWPMAKPLCRVAWTLTTQGCWDLNNSHACQRLKSGAALLKARSPLALSNMWVPSQFQRLVLQGVDGAWCLGIKIIQVRTPSWAWGSLCAPQVCMYEGLVRSSEGGTASLKMELRSSRHTFSSHKCVHGCVPG